MDYTQSQQRAIQTIDRNLQIIACAGSGKTQVISRRVVEILKRKKDVGIGPQNIVAFTFTEKAAAELKDRIQRLCLEVLGTDYGLAEMYVGTIHGYCLNLLQQPPAYQYLKYSVLTEVQQRLLIDRNSSKSGLTHVPLLSGGTLSRYKDSRLYQMLLSVLQEGDVAPASIPAAVREAEEQYRALLEDKKFLDYSGMVLQAVEQLKANPAVRKQMQATVRYLVVDEYQDVNPLQEQLVREIAALGANLCVVGDDDQTIYQWRGSDIHNIVQFQSRYPNVTAVRLNENFRSSKGIVDTARRIVERNPDRLKKEMQSTNAQPFERGDILAMQQFNNPEEEANWIAKKIQWLLGTTYCDGVGKPARGLTYSDIAILVRAWKDAGPIVEALGNADIPYLGGGMNSLFDTPEASAIREAFYFLDRNAPRGGPPVSEAAVRAALRDGFPGITKEDLDRGLEFLRRCRSEIPNGKNNQLFLQRVFLDLLEAMSIREERIGDKTRSGEVIFFNLGKFSQLISDFERIHFHSAPARLYVDFAGFLQYQAADYYPEETQETAHARPEAVRVMTVHQAKGMQWPAVFVPCLRRNRFPSSRHGGRSIWNVIDERVVPNADRYKGTVEDERRLFYVALTRAEKYLYCSWAPVPGNQQQKRVSEFFTDFSQSEFVLGKDPHREPVRLPQLPRMTETPLPLTFSDLRYFFECPYQFKLRFLYGFDAPINQALGYGRSLHNALCQIHGESIQGRVPKLQDAPKLVQDHMHLPFANGEVRANLMKQGEQAIRRYLKEHGNQLKSLEHAEKIIELKLSDGIVVSGRIDLIRRTDTNEIAIVDFKSDDNTQPKEMTWMQLHVYAAGYRKATGKGADLLEIHNLEQGHIHREEVEESMIETTLAQIINAGKKIRNVDLPKHPVWCETCVSCDMAGICRKKPVRANSRSSNGLPTRSLIEAG